MLKLNKVQTEALVDEIQERLESAEIGVNLPSRVSREWTKVNEDLAKLREKELEMNAAEAKYYELREDYNNLRKRTESKIRTFERNNNVEVDWRHIDYDEGEKPSVKLPASDYREKIRRQIAIMSIEKDGPMTADALIEAVASKFSK